MEANSSINQLSLASTSSNTDSAVVLVSSDVVVDSMTNACDSPAPPQLIHMPSVGSAAGSEEESAKLTLAYERLYEIPIAIVERFSDHVRYLDISHNKITNLDALVHFSHLTSLVADNNPITENSLMPPLPRLQLLWLNQCKISSLYPWADTLREACPALRHLSLMGNPAAPGDLTGGTFYEYLQYRLFVISQFPSLQHLDERAVTEDQRAEARRLYRRPLLERLVRPSAWWGGPTRWGGGGRGGRAALGMGGNKNPNRPI